VRDGFQQLTKLKEKIKGTSCTKQHHWRTCLVIHDFIQGNLPSCFPIYPSPDSISLNRNWSQLASLHHHPYTSTDHCLAALIRHTTTFRCVFHGIFDRPTQSGFFLSSLHPFICCNVHLPLSTSRYELHHDGHNSSQNPYPTESVTGLEHCNTILTMQAHLYSVVKLLSHRWWSLFCGHWNERW